MNGQAVVVIPARYASTRLPGKPLIKLAGKPMIQWVYERALQIPGISRVIVATDDERIRQAVGQFGGSALMTPENLANGSERAGYVARELDAEIVVNLQGDEPLMPAAAVGEAIRQLQVNPQLKIATLGIALEREDDWRKPSVVKVLVDKNMEAIYFSRAPIPYPRDDGFKPLPNLLRHLGVYVYRRGFLLEFLGWPEGMLEEREKLEQLRVLENGHRIKVVKTEQFSPGVDTPEDVKFVENILKEKELIGER